MKEIPILFSTPMVQAKLEGRKSMTRRTTGLEKVNEDPDAIEFLRFQQYKDGSYRAIFQHKLADEPGSVKCPYGKAGDLLWVREKFAKTIGVFEPDTTYSYFADSFHWSFFPNDDMKGETSCQWHDEDLAKEVKWKPSIYMPKEAARIWLQVEEIRVERLQDISEEDAMAEGVRFITRTSGICYMDYKIGEYVYPITAKQSFKSLFLSINGQPKPLREHGETGLIISYSAIAWDQKDYDKTWAKYNGIYRNKPLSVIINPWVWVVKYKMLSTTGKPENI